MESKKFKDMYNGMYDKIVIPSDTDNKIKKYIVSEKSAKKAARKTYFKTGAGIIAAAAMLLCVLNIKTVSSAMNKVINYFSYSFEIGKDEKSSEKLEMKTRKITFSKNAPKTDCKFNSVKDAGKKIGVELLESDKMYKFDGCIEYTAVKDENENLIGAFISDDMYAVGDLKDVSVEKAKESGAIDILKYKPGTLYKSPIMAQIAIKNDIDTLDRYSENELSYASKNTQIDLTGKAGKKHNAEVYTLKKHNVKVVIYDEKTDGPAGWGNNDDTQMNVTMAIFVYNGVEYIYVGNVNHDIMKDFLDSLN